MASTIAAGTTAGTALAFSGDTSGSLQLQTNGTTTAVTLDTSQNATFAGKVTSAGALTLASNGTTTAVTIDTSQNVGIGTASPSSKLQITGQSGFGGSVANSAASINITGTGNDATTLEFNTGSGSAFDISLFAAGASPASAIYLNNRNNAPMVFLTNNTERMRIASNGIVTMSAYGAGAATFSAAGVISSVSDETWKIKDGVPLDPDAMLKKLEPGYWFYNEEKAPTFGGDRQLGFYAQNVNAAIGPEAAPTPEEGKPWGYYDRSVLAVTVMSLQKALENIQEQQALIIQLQADVAALKGVK